jgi:hypothetical protein
MENSKFEKIGSHDTYVMLQSYVGADGIVTVTISLGGSK